jgi:hypothetical protein
MGFSVALGEITTDDPKLGKGLGYEGECRMRWALIRLGDAEDAPVIDVEQWLKPKITGQPYPSCSNNGIGRIALEVDEIDKEYRALKDKGVAFLSPPQTLDVPGFGDFKFHFSRILTASFWNWSKHEMPLRAGSARRPLTESHLATGITPVLETREIVFRAQQKPQITKTGRSIPPQALFQEFKRTLGAESAVDAAEHR